MGIFNKRGAQKNEDRFGAAGRIVANITKRKPSLMLRIREIAKREERKVTEVVEDMLEKSLSHEVGDTRRATGSPNVIGGGHAPSRPEYQEMQRLNEQGSFPNQQKPMGFLDQFEQFMRIQTMMQSAFPKTDIKELIGAVREIKELSGEINPVPEEADDMQQVMGMIQPILQQRMSQNTLPSQIETSMPKVLVTESGDIIPHPSSSSSKPETVPTGEGFELEEVSLDELYDVACDFWDNLPSLAKTSAKGMKKDNIKKLVNTWVLNNYELEEKEINSLFERFYNEKIKNNKKE